MKSIETVISNPIKIQNNTFRDGHQSIYATRMKTEDMIPIAEEMDSCVYWAIEVWRGATFDQDLAKEILKNYKCGQEPLSGRLADYLPPEIETAAKSIGNLARNDEDVLTWMLFPATMGKFLQTKYGISQSVSA